MRSLINHKSLDLSWPYFCWIKFQKSFHSWSNLKIFVVFGLSSTEWVVSTRQLHALIQFERGFPLALDARILPLTLLLTSRARIDSTWHCCCRILSDLWFVPGPPGRLCAFTVGLWLHTSIKKPCGTTGDYCGTTVGLLRRPVSQLGPAHVTLMTRTLCLKERRSRVLGTLCRGSAGTSIAASTLKAAIRPSCSAGTKRLLTEGVIGFKPLNILVLSLLVTSVRNGCEIINIYL